MLMANSLKTKRNCQSLRATLSGPGPGDFPLGSAESRAAARAILQRPMSLYDEDCLRIYRGMIYVCGPAYLSSNHIAHTDTYKHGQEIRDRLYGPIIPAHLDPKHQRLFSPPIPRIFSREAGV